MDLYNDYELASALAEELSDRKTTVYHKVHVTLY